MATVATEPQRIIPKVSSLLTCQVETSFAASEDLQPVWDGAVLRLGGPIYMTYDWLETWWDFYGAGRQLRLYIFREGTSIVGLLPIYLEQFGVTPFNCTVARLLGANIPPKTFNPPISAAHAVEILRSLLRQLFSKELCDLVSLGPVSSVWPGNAAIQPACTSLSEFVAPPGLHSKDVQTFFVLPATFEEYLAGLSSTERKHRMKRLRHLEREHQVACDVVSDSDSVPAEFDFFVTLHARQWKAAGKGGHFAAWPNGEAYNRALVQRQAARGRVRFFRMLVDGQVVANRYTFLLGNTLFSELPAREVGEPWDTLGVGAISMIKFNESAISSGIAHIDSGLGTYEHKNQLGGEQIPVGIWRIQARPFACALRARAFLLVSWLMYIVCHKMWYQRLLPRMPANFKRSQSLAWLRFNA